MVPDEPPSLDAGAVVDKGPRRLRAIQARRADALARLHDDNDREVITP
jgi:hypothetical protein